MTTELEQLLELNRNDHSRLDAIARALLAQDDLRWLFATCHANITSGLLKNYQQFTKPAPLLHLNHFFANRFLTAIDSPAKASDKWRKAFAVCAELKSVHEGAVRDLDGPRPLGIPFALEICSQHLANVHINEDIPDGLRATSEQGRCTVPPKDFGDMLILVEKGTHDAFSKATWWPLSMLEDWFQGLFVESWRSKQYLSVCGDEVPGPDSALRKKIDGTVPWHRTDWFQYVSPLGPYL